MRGGLLFFFFFSSRRRHTRSLCDWSSDVCSSDLDLISQASGGTYGGLGVHAELRLGRGMMVGHNAVALLMRRAGLAGATGRPKWGHAKPDQIAAELVDPQLHPSEPNQLWVTDITEHPPARPSSMCGGAGCLLPSGGRLVDRCHPTAALVTNALGMAIQTPTPPAGAVIHSDHACRSPPGRSPSGPGLGPGALHGSVGTATTTP